MLFKDQIGAFSPFDYHQLRKIHQKGIERVTLQLNHLDYTADEIKEMLNITHVKPIAIQLPSVFKLGHHDIDLGALKKLMQQIAAAFDDNQPFIILETKSVALGEIFEYFETKPGDFKALYDFKEVWIEQLIDNCHKIKEIADSLQLPLLIQNVPMGSPHYFEPGNAKIYPALRTPRHLVKIAESTGVNVCFHTGNARIATNVLHYMKRSRSVFAAATEEEILSSPADWLEFYEEVAPYVKLIHLCDSLSWGDTESSNHIPFLKDHIPELLRFAELLGTNAPPVVLHLNEMPKPHDQSSYLQQMIQLLKELKTG